MRYLSVCSGIEAATVAWGPLGWKAAAFAEIEGFPSAVLRHHYPDVPNAGDFTAIKGDEFGAIDLLVGGTPCQAFSIAGLRGGLADARGNLALEFIRLAQRVQPRWIVWENVPGVLSSTSDAGGESEAHAFSCFLAGLSELGYGWAYRVLDAQYFGVPQRRRRVFVVGHLGGRFERAAAVLFERESMFRYPPPRRQTGQGFTYDIAPSLVCRGRGVERTGGTRGQDPVVAVCMATGQAGAEIGIGIGIGTTLNCNHEAPIVVHALRGEGFDASEDGTGRGIPLVPVAISTAHTKSNGNGFSDHVAYTLERTNGQAIGRSEELTAYTEGIGSLVRGGQGGIHMGVMTPAMAVRRLTPRECERLQGFPDDYTRIGEKTPDGPRYKALGNSMAVPVMRWIGERIEAVEAMKGEA